MSTSINIYPKLNDDLIDKIGFIPGQYEFYYKRTLDESLKATPPEDSRITNLLFLEDEQHIWNLNQHHFKVKRIIEIQNPVFLFGPMGIAPEEAVVGLGIVWKCKDSSIRGAEEIGFFGISDRGPLTFTFEQTFLKGDLKNEVHFSTILYVKSAGNSRQNELHLANRAGLQLGEIDDMTIVMEGSGSEFPVVETGDPSMPLWWINCMWSDPQEDAFSEENVRLCINTDHKRYPLVFSDKLNDSPLFLEIMASAIEIIIHKVMKSELWTDIRSGNNNSSGSIGEAVQYFIETFELDVDSPDTLSTSIRSYLERNM